MTADVRPWEWPFEKVESVVAATGAGEVLSGGRSKHSWPNGAQAAVALSFDTDYQTLTLRDGGTSPAGLALGEYGARVGVHRILALLKEFGLPATFFVPAVSAMLYPDNVTSILQGGHEIAAHGWIHERGSNLSPDVERELLHRSLDKLTEISGHRPVGIRTPSWDFTPATLQILRECGLLYDSSLMADDEPYELLASGEPTGLVEIPVNWIRDDVPYLFVQMAGASRPYTPPRQLVAIWKDEFDAAYREGGLFQLTMHPQVSGYRSRIVALRELLAHLTKHDDVWFTTHEDLARHAAANAAFSGAKK